MFPPGFHIASRYGGLVKVTLLRKSYFIKT
jgi:hypothetical protein